MLAAVASVPGERCFWTGLKECKLIEKFHIPGAVVSAGSSGLAVQATCSSGSALWNSGTLSHISRNGQFRNDCWKGRFRNERFCNGCREDGRRRLRFVVPRCSSTSSGNSNIALAEIGGAEQKNDYLANVYTAVGLQDGDLQQHITVAGLQELMGMEGSWRMTWNTDGRFYESYEGPELQYEWAYDGESGPWSADAAGRVSTLDLDDREVCFLASWVRTGFWLTKEGQKELNIDLEPQKSDEIETTFRLQLKDGKVAAYLVVENKSHLPARLNVKAFGGYDKWEFGDWQIILPGYQRKFPRAIVHHPPAGGRDMYTLTTTKLESDEEVADEAKGEGGIVYTTPTSRLVSRSTRSYPKTHIDSKLSSSVKMFQAESGHNLVRPLINGKDVGYFIVDTGASSLTIAPETARELEMESFGEAYVTGVEGEVKCSFRRAKSLQVGPLTIAEPIFMEVPMAGVVRGVSPVVGICGYDIFFDCIVEMSYKRATLSLYDPSSFIYRLTSAQWQNMFMLENVPHVPATFNGKEEAIFLLDTGAGGVDLIFHGRAVERYRLKKSLKLAGSAKVKGVNSSGTGLQVQYGILDTLELAGQTFQKVRALFPMEETGGSLDFSEYTAGVICGDLLTNLLLVLDYGNRRFALLDGADATLSSRPVQ